MLKKYRRYLAEILQIRCKTQYNQSINQKKIWYFENQLYHILCINYENYNQKKTKVLYQKLIMVLHRKLWNFNSLWIKVLCQK